MWIYLENFSNMERLVFGLNSTICYHCGYEGKWKEVLPKVLNTFPNRVLISAVDMPMVAAKVIHEAVGKDRVLIDSGGFGLYKKEMKMGKDNPKFHDHCEKMKKRFLKLLEACPCSLCFELDNEYFRRDEDLLSPKNYCREEVKAITGRYPVPVFKIHQGFDYWKRLCDSPDYDWLAIGGLAQTRAWHTKTEEIRTLMDYARHQGKKVHLLGCQNVEAFKEIQPDSVDYLIFQYAINLEEARKQNPGVEDYSLLRPTMVSLAVAKARQRSFLYESYQRG